MTRSISPRLPLLIDDGLGYQMNITFTQLVLQNLRMLILTNPGERIMEPNFGVGIKKMLFEQNTPSAKAEIQTRIRKQVSDFLPYINIIDISFYDSYENSDLPDNYLGIVITFYIAPLEEQQELKIYFDLDNIDSVTGLVPL
jgi:phage baseplate assembly protein W